MKKTIILFIIIISSINVSAQKNMKKDSQKYPVTKTEQEWKAILSPMQYSVLREKETEHPFTGEYDLTFKEGTYFCAACGTKLFESDSKFDAHCGWPSFDKAIKGAVIYKKDSSFGMIRTEILCAQCGGHLGHVFDDGPTETHERFCVNSASLSFKPKKKQD